MGINERKGTSQDVRECHPRCSSYQTGAEGAESHKKEKARKIYLQTKPASPPALAAVVI
jgi:hypothetical protein